MTLIYVTIEAMSLLVTHVTPPGKRATQADVARLAGVHRTTVSLALKNFPNIPERTRQRIRKIAKQIGYTPDPMLSALAAYRNRQRPRVYQGTFAWLVNDMPPFSWKGIAAFGQYFKGASKQAATHGFTLEEFTFGGGGVTPARLAGILRSRNIRGILVCPQPRPNMKLDFPWEEFSAVTFGYTLASPRLHCVTTSHYRATLQSMEELFALGYRRIGFVMAKIHDERLFHTCLSGYLADVHIGHPTRHKIPPLILKDIYDVKGLLQWYRKYRPEVMLMGPGLDKLAEKSGLKFPGEVGLACCSLPYNYSPTLSGVQENSFHVGEVAADHLVAMVQRGETGVPESPLQLLVETTWFPGKTLRKP